MKKNSRDFLQAILNKKIYIILISVIFAVTGIGYTLVNVELVSNKKILFGTAENMNTYAELLTGSELLEEVLQNSNVSLRVSDLEKRLKVDVLDDMNMIEIKVSGENAEEIHALSTQMVTSFKSKVQEIYGEVAIYQVDDSINYYRKGNVIITGMLSFISGIVVAILIFVVGILLDTKIKSCKDIEEITDLKSLISIPCMKSIRKKKLSLKNIRMHNSGTFKLLMTNIQFLNLNNLKSKTLLITSPRSFAGKTYVATNLAIEFAKAGKKVIMIDSDMRKGRLAKIFNLPNELGFSNYLSDLNANGNHINERINCFINDTEIKNLNVITSGNIPPNPVELLKGDKVKELIKDLKVFYDVIIFDTVSVLEAQEALLLASRCDLTLMMSAYGDTRRDDCTIAYEKLENVDGSMIGMGLNKAPDRKWRKKFIIFRNRVKQRASKIFAKMNVHLKKIGNMLKSFRKIEVVFQVIFGIFVQIFSVVRNVIIGCRNGIKLKSQDVREQFKNYMSKREKIKLIEAGSTVPEPEKNIIKDVYVNELTKMEIPSMPPIQPNSSEPEKRATSKLELMKQQEKGNIKLEKIVEKKEELKSEKTEEIVKKEPIDVIEKVETKETEEVSNVVEMKKNTKQEEMRKMHEELKEKQRIEREKKEEEKRLRNEQIKEFEEIDFQTEENVTEEMIRRQVEIDDMIRIAEIEFKEERENVKKQKFLKKQEKEKERLAKKELKARIKEERKISKEQVKKRHREEARIKEELQEDNLYPKFRM